MNQQTDPQEETYLPSRNVRNERFQLGFLFFGIASIFAVAFLLELILALTIPHFAPALAEKPWFSYAYSMVPMYLFGMPLSLFFFSKCRTQKPERRPMGTGTFLGYLAICFATLWFGNLLSSAVNGIIGQLTGKMPENSLEAVTSESPLWLTVICIGFLAPVLEELFFRKIVIDRLLSYGELPAILISGISFGLIHGNFYQFFYAALIGILFGLIYIRTGSILPSMLIHVIINLLGGAYTVEMTRRLDLSSFETVTDLLGADRVGLLMLAGYAGWMFLSTVGAVIALCLMLPHLHFRRSDSPMTGKDWLRAGVLNPGVWCFVFFVLFSFAISVFS